MDIDCTVLYCNRFSRKRAYTRTWFSHWTDLSELMLVISWRGISSECYCSCVRPLCPPFGCAWPSHVHVDVAGSGSVLQHEWEWFVDSGGDRSVSRWAWETLPAVASWGPSHIQAVHAMDHGLLWSGSLSSLLKVDEVSELQKPRGIHQLGFQIFHDGTIPLPETSSIDCYGCVGSRIGSF